MNKNNDTRTPAELQEWLAEVEQRAEKATPGPWDYNEDVWYERDEDGDELGMSYFSITFDDNTELGRTEEERDAAFVARSREDIPRLVQELRRAWARIENCYKAIDELVDREAKAEEAMLAPTPYLDKVSTERAAAILKQYGIDWPTEQEASHD